MNNVIRHHDNLTKLEMLQIQWADLAADKERIENALVKIEAEIAVEKMKNKEAA